MLRSLAFVFIATPAIAGGDLQAQLAGPYGAVDDPAYSCAQNPIDLRFEDQPPHAVFSWNSPRQIFDDSTTTKVIYDLVEEVPNGLVMRLEGENRMTEAGDPVVWILRPDADLRGFCWGRTDWPVVRCEPRFRRCDLAPSS